jgi:hypothetical protein
MLNRKLSIFFILILIFIFLIQKCDSQEIGLVNVSVADLRSQPIAGNVSFAIDPLELTQLIYYESVEILSETSNGWF